jgi:SSS family solute:Na+ symporter
MSTLSSVSLAGASVLAVDLYKGKLNEKASDRNVNIVMKALCLAFVAVSVLLAILNESFGIAAIAYMMGLSWGTLAGCFIGPYVLGLLWKRVTRPAVWSSIVGSLVLTVTLIIVFGFDKNGWNADFGTVLKDGVATSPLIGVICMIFSLVITAVVSLFTRKPDDAILEAAFDKSFEGEIK